MRKKITWKPGVQRRDPIPRPHRPEEKLSAGSEALLREGALYPGAMCRLTHTLYVEKENDKFIAPPFPIASRWSGGAGHLPSGSIAVYAGTVRDEMTGNVGTIHVLQHTFVVGGGRYIIHLNDVELVG